MSVENVATDQIVTFTSDFGNREYYVGAVKGSILSLNPQAKIVDISHDVISHDLLGAAFTLLGAYWVFPAGTIHLVVVDPGVGSERRNLIVSTEKHFFVTPDNGVLSLIAQREQVSQVISIEAKHYFRHPVSPTFHGRDILGPVVGSLSRGIDLTRFGPEIDDFVRLKLPEVKRVDADTLEGFVLHIDKFGNVITSLHENDVTLKFGRKRRPTTFLLNECEVTRQVRFYAEGEGCPLFSLVGSSGFYEIAALKKSAAHELNARRGMPVVASFSD